MSLEGPLLPRAARAEATLRSPCQSPPRSAVRRLAAPVDASQGARYKTGPISPDLSSALAYPSRAFLETCSWPIPNRRRKPRARPRRTAVQQGAADPPPELRPQSGGGDCLRQQGGRGRRAEGSRARHRAVGAEGGRASPGGIAQVSRLAKRVSAMGALTPKKRPCCPWQPRRTAWSRSSPLSIR